MSHHITQHGDRMSITSVSSKIKAAMRDSFISTAEAKTIVTEAEKGPVTVGEARAVAALFDKAPRAAPPGMMMTMAIPEHPGDVIFERGAKNVLETFFKKNDVPAGENLAKFVNKIEGKLDEVGLGARLATAPNTKKLHMVRLPYPTGAADLPSRTAFLDAKKNEFYVQVSGGLMAPSAANTHWYGPISLDAPKGDVTTQRTAQLKSAFDRVATAGTINWTMAGVMEQHLGVRFAQVTLASDGYPDGYNYTAFIPLGALTPTAPQKDPNKVAEFYVQRTGGFAGLTQSFGPLTANVLPGDGSGWGPRGRPTGV